MSAVRHHSLIAPLVCALLCSTPWAHAQALQPGMTLLQQASPGDRHLAGTIVEDEVTPFSYQLAVWNAPTTPIETVTGEIESRVVKADDGTYDFYWRLRDASFWTLTLTSSALNGTDYRTGWLDDGSGGIPGGLAYFSPSAAGHSGSLGFAFGDIAGLEAAEFNSYYSNWPMDKWGGVLGPNSDWVFLDTNATSYARNAVIGTDIALKNIQQIQGVAIATFGPVAAVPEPATTSLFLLGGVAGAFAQWRRRARAR